MATICDFCKEEMKEDRDFQYTIYIKKQAWATSSYDLDKELCSKCEKEIIKLINNYGK